MSDHLTQAERERLWDTIAGVRDAAPRVANDAATDDIIDAVLDSRWVHRLITDRLATVTARAKAAEAKVARVEALADEWEGIVIDDEWHAADLFADVPSALRAALAPAPTEGANGRQTGHSERVGTKEDA